MTTAPKRYKPPASGAKRVTYDDRRGSARSRGYTKQWEAARATFLGKNPLCVQCLKEGHCESATVVDHVIPHRGSYDLFWNVDNWQGLCVRHHNAKSAKERLR